MRAKDDQKREAIFHATIKIINDEGYAKASMSKIAKEAGISQGLLYTYFESKEDLFQKTYLIVKESYLEHCGRNVVPDGDTQTQIRKICSNLLDFLREHRDWFYFSEQSRMSPLIRSLTLEKTIMERSAVTTVFSNGIKTGVLKPLQVTLLVAFCFYPIEQIYAETSASDKYLKDIDYEEVFSMCWDAIRCSEQNS